MRINYAIWIIVGLPEFGLVDPYVSDVIIRTYMTTLQDIIILIKVEK